ncbi:hypothetical protein HH297_14850 [Xanthomonas sp. Kuri4-3]
MARDFAAPGLKPKLGFDPAEDIAAPFIATGARPRVAILREQGVNGQIEMAHAFERAGFSSHDVHMSDLIEGRVALDQFAGLAACGGFSYGDVLGAGRGWATSILERGALREAFARFFAREDSFALGVCNGCQMMSQLKDIIPGAEHWPRFLRNRSEQFEARTALLEVVESPSIFLRGMAGSRIPVAVAHGEGRAEFDSAVDQVAARVALRYVDGEVRMALFDPAGWCEHYAQDRSDCERLRGVYEQYLARQRQMAAVLDAHGVPVLYVHVEPGQDAREALQA